MKNEVHIIKDRIEELRYKLDGMMKAYPKYSNEDVLELSMKLDNLLIEFMYLKHSRPEGKAKVSG